MKSCTTSDSSLDRHSLSSPLKVTVKVSQLIGWSLVGQYTHSPSLLCDGQKWQASVITYGCVQKCVCERLTALCVSGRETMICALWSQIILQKSCVVFGRGFWVTINSRLWWYPCKRHRLVESHHITSESNRSMRTSVLPLNKRHWCSLMILQVL